MQERHHAAQCHNAGNDQRTLTPTFTDYRDGMPDLKPYTIIDPSVQFGPYCIVWHFTSIGFGTTIGDNVCIGSHVYIGNFCTIGNEARIQTGVFLPNHTQIGERVFIGPHVCFTDDKHPRVRSAYTAQPPTIEDEVSIGAGSVILPGIRLGKGCQVGAGAVVTHDVPPNVTVVGTPAYEIISRRNDYELEKARIRGA